MGAIIPGIALAFAAAAGFIAGIVIAGVVSAVWVVRQWRLSANRKVLVLKAFAFTACAGVVTSVLFFKFLGAVLLLVAIWGIFQYR